MLSSPCVAVRRLSRTYLVAGIVALVGTVGPTYAQDVVIWSSPGGSRCSAVNLASTELYVVASTGELADPYTLPDTIIEGTYVDDLGQFFLDGELVGYVTWDVDGDGLETIWLVDVNGYVLDVDPAGYTFLQTEHIPADFTDVRCDIIPFVDLDDTDDLFGLPFFPFFCGSGVASWPILLTSAFALGGMRLSRRPRSGRG